MARQTWVLLISYDAFDMLAIQVTMWIFIDMNIGTQIVL